ncbi:MAG: hypothetical protein ISF22_05730 [Methanomassiliicoccus sp.]|nr:hypothetical protein [Methanomassiliicoccus sp.]
MSSYNNLTVPCIVFGLIYAALGLAEITSFWISEGWLVVLTTGNIMMGAVLLLAGAVFLTGAKEVAAGREGEGYLIVGCLLGLFIGLVALLTMGANGAEHLLGNEDLGGWVPMDDLTLAIVMMFPTGVLLRYGLRAFRSALGEEVKA